MLDPYECKVYCQECNAYLYSVSACDHQWKDIIIVPCPCIKDPIGKCTGRYKKKEK